SYDLPHSSTGTATVCTILVLTQNDASYIDINLFDINKQEFYTKMNLMGEITLEDHRGTLITGYLPNEIIRQSIFNFVHQDDLLIKLHGLWRCFTTGLSKLQWRLKTRDGNIVYLQTEYVLVSGHSDSSDTIVARNEVLNSDERAKFLENQKNIKLQCAEEMKGHHSFFKKIPNDQHQYNKNETNHNEQYFCKLSIPSINMCFTTSKNKLNPIHVNGNIFHQNKTTRPLNIQDYIDILIDNEKWIDNELQSMINDIQSLTAKYRRIQQQQQ
ncbi:unnamed protein product, partial [Didymodactylos carnosus]